MGIREVAELASQIDNPFDLSVGQPDFDVVPIAKEAAIKAIESGQNGYTSTGGRLSLRNSIASSLKKEFPLLGNFQQDFDIVVTPGVTAGLYSSLLTCTDPGDEVLITDPFFLAYPEIVKLIGASAKFIDTYPDFHLTAEKVLQRISSKTKALIINSPGNPTGSVIAKEELVRLVSLTEKHGITIISDEIYCDFSYQDNYTSLLDITNGGIVLRGFSKSHGMTGWRIGYAVAPRHVALAMERIQGQVYVCAPSVAQVAAESVIGIPSSKIISEYRARWEMLTEILSDKFPGTTTSGGFFAFVPVPIHLELTATEFVKEAIKERVLVIPGKVFSNKDTHFRISMTCQRDRLKEALKRLVKTVERLEAR